MFSEFDGFGEPLSSYVLADDDPPTHQRAPGVSNPSRPIEIVTNTFGEFLVETVAAEFAGRE